MRVVKWGLNANKKQEIRFFLRLENIPKVCQDVLFCDVEVFIDKWIGIYIYTI